MTDDRENGYEDGKAGLDYKKPNNDGLAGATSSAEDLKQNANYHRGYEQGENERKQK